jgi:hypothetical protein
MQAIIRRVLIPILIITLPISAMIAYTLYYQKAKRHRTAQRTQNVSPVTFGAKH